MRPKQSSNSITAYIFFVIIPLIMLSLFIYYAYNYSVSSPLRVTSEEARKLRAKGQIDTIVDVRTDLEWSVGHFEGATHVPVSKIKDQAEIYLPNKYASILVYCNTGQRARMAAEELVKQGYTNVKYIAGPYTTLY
jgi:phage shock protein E